MILALVMAFLMNIAGTSNPQIKKRKQTKKNKSVLTEAQKYQYALSMPPPLKKEEARALADAAPVFEEYNLLTQPEGQSNVNILQSLVLKASSADAFEQQLPSTQNVVDVVFENSASDNAVEAMMANLDIVNPLEPAQERAISPDMFGQEIPFVLDPRVEEVTKYIDCKISNSQITLEATNSDIAYFVNRERELEDELLNIKKMILERRRDKEYLEKEIENFRFCKQKLLE